MQPAEEEAASNTRLQVAILLIITVLIYSPVLFNFFVGDDFVHLAWLSKCKADPSLLLRNFNHNWLDVVTVKFYRPVISVFMFLDYLVWRTNGFGFHVTNLIFHVINTLLVFFIARIFVVVKVKERNPRETQVEKAVGWPFLAALLFAIYPLHPEAVSWITGRVDSIVTTFYLSSLFTFIVWSITRAAPYLVLSLINACLALLSKEMAITLPAVMFACSYWLSVGSILPKQKPGQAILTAVRKTFPFWAILTLYILVRGLSLGTFVGGYDNSLFFVADRHKFLSSWLHGIRMTLVPINRSVIGDKNIFTIVWCVGMFQALAGIFSALFNKASRSLTLLLAVITIASIGPVYKIFAIGDDLEGSRLAYLSTSFMCMLLAFGIFELFRLLQFIPAKVRSRIVLLSVAAWVISGLVLLYKNNNQWSDAGMECNAIRRQLEHLYDTTRVSDHLLLVGLPDQINGAYVCRNVSPGILEPPQFSRPKRDCLLLSSYDPVFPFGFLKKSLTKAATAADNPAGAVKIFFWSSKRKNFVPVSLPIFAAGSDSSHSPDEAEKVVSEAGQGEGGGGFGRSDKKLLSEIYNCWLTDFVFCRQALVPPGMKNPARQNPATEKQGQLSLEDHAQQQVPRLQFQNDLSEDGVLTKVDGAPFLHEGSQGFIYALRAKPLWACGGKEGRFRIEDPVASGGRTCEKIELIEASRIMPSLDFDNSGYLGTKGFLHLSKSNPSEQLRCVENNVLGADHFVLEILRPNLFLAPSEQNNREESKQQLKKLIGSGRTGRITIQLNDLQGEGLYQARLWSVDKNDKPLGVAGDHVIIAVDPN
jgi:hypothetical protein